MRLAITLQGSKKDLDETLRRLLRDRRIKVIFLTWEEKR
jgi:hypothetical protein